MIIVIFSRHFLNVLAVAVATVMVNSYSAFVHT